MAQPPSTWTDQKVHRIFLSTFGFNGWIFFGKIDAGFSGDWAPMRHGPGDVSGISTREDHSNDFQPGAPPGPEVCALNFTASYGIAHFFIADLAMKKCWFVHCKTAIPRAFMLAWYPSIFFHSQPPGDTGQLMPQIRCGLYPPLLDHCPDFPIDFFHILLYLYRQWTASHSARKKPLQKHGFAWSNLQRHMIHLSWLPASFRAPTIVLLLVRTSSAHF